MAGQSSASPDVLLVTATAHARNGQWRVHLVGSPEISVLVGRLAEVDAAVSARLAHDLRRDDVAASVHIRWYDIEQGVPWPSGPLGTDDDPGATCAGSNCRGPRA